MSTVSGLCFVYVGYLESGASLVCMVVLLLSRWLGLWIGSAAHRLGWDFCRLSCCLLEAACAEHHTSSFAPRFQQKQHEFIHALVGIIA